MCSTYPEMRFAAILSVVLVIATNCAGAPLSVSGVYNLIVGGLALTHVLTGGSSPITATPPSGATSQAWTAVVNPATGQATLQSVSTLAFAAISGDKFVLPSTAPFSWNVITLNGQTLFCTSDNFCISTAANSVGLSPRGSGAPQSFDLSPITPPAVFYQIQNVGTNTVFAVGFVPSPTFVTAAPATDRSEIWGVGNVANSQISLQNLDAGGLLSVATNGTIGVFSVSVQFPWTVVFVSGVGQVVLASGGFLSVSGGSLKIGNVLDSTAAWIFIPVNATAFLP